MLLTVSRYSTSQWPWETVRALATGGQLVVTAEAAQYVSQHGHGLVKLPADMVQILDGYFKDAGLTGKTAKLRTRALTDQLKSLSRSSARGGLQPYRIPDTGTAAAAAKPSQIMTQEQLQEERQMDDELSKFAQTLGPEMVEQHRAARERAAALAAIPLPRTKGGRIKTKAKSALLEHVYTNGFLTLPHEYVRAAFDLPPTSTLDDPDKNMEIKKLTPAYSASQTQAYALSRLPGCYAASRRIFRELAVRFPDLNPKSLLDFGAGPGTATWAAQEAWSSSLSRVLAIESSPYMRQLGAQLEAARRFAHTRAPVVHWRSELPAPARSQRMRRQQACHDVVVASYVLNEVLDPQERRDLVRRLWGLTSGILVLVEPGTPAGAANIQEARSAILQHEARKAAKVQRKLTGLQETLGSSTAAEAVSLNSSSSPDFNLHQKLTSKWYGAHVVAPCPHDGPCPLAAPGSKAWCHFGTRFQRPANMQASKALKGTHVNPADHQDERYSYVVIRRGARPAAAPEVEISRAFIPNVPAAASHVTDPQDHSEDNGSILSVDLGRPQQRDLVLGQRSQPAVSRGHAAQLNPVDDVTSQHATQQSTGMTIASSAQINHAPLIQNPLVQVDELQRLYVLAGLAGPTKPQVEQPLSLQGSPTSYLGTDNDGHVHEDHFTRVNARSDGHGQGFVNRLIALEDAGVEWAGSVDVNLPSHLPPEVVGPGARPLTASSTTAGSCTAKRMSDSSQDTLYEHDPESNKSLDSSLIFSQDKALDGGTDVAAAASRSWSRLIRPPRKRGGHVILDVCTAGTSPDGRQDFACGQLERHVVARSDAEKWMGMAAYSLVQHARWGDLWPSYYHRNPKKQVLRGAVEGK